MDPILSINFFGVDDPRELSEPEPLAKSPFVVRFGMGAAENLDLIDAANREYQKTGKLPDLTPVETTTAESRDDGVLEKSAGSRKLQAIAKWVKSQLALGKSVEELVAHAMLHDRDTALLIEQAAAL